MPRRRKIDRYVLNSAICYVTIEVLFYQPTHGPAIWNERDYLPVDISWSGRMRPLARTIGTAVRLNLFNSVGAMTCRMSINMSCRPGSDRANEETDSLFYADQRNFFKVEKWTKDGARLDGLLYAGSSLVKAREIFFDGHQPPATNKAVSSAANKSAQGVAAGREIKDLQRTSTFFSIVSQAASDNANRRQCSRYAASCKPSSSTTLAHNQDGASREAL